MVKYVKQNLGRKQTREKEFHYTDESLVKDCLQLINFNKEDVVLDVGSGENMVWFNNFPVKNKDWVEIEKGRDFFEYDKKVDWCVGNPPFRLLPKMVEKASNISNFGIGFLMSIDGINSLTPLRLEKLKNKGFSMKRLFVVTCKRWFGRYYFVIFTKEDNDFVSYSKTNYE